MVLPVVSRTDTGVLILQCLPVKWLKGRLFNVVGEAIDGIGPVAKDKNAYPIHRKPPAYEQLSTEKEVLYTGDQSDRRSSHMKGGKIGPSVVPVWDGIDHGIDQ